MFATTEDTAMSTIQHPSRHDGLMREARRELARQEEAEIDENTRTYYGLNAEGRRLHAERAWVLIKWTLALGLIAMLFGIPCLFALMDMLAYLDALLKGDASMWQPLTDRAAFVSALRFTAFVYPSFAVGAVAAILL